MDNATKCQTHSKGLHYGREHIEREIYNEKGFSIGAELFEEIVRCKDCKHYKPFDKSKKFDCPQGLYAVFESDYCSHGERGRRRMTIKNPTLRRRTKGLSECAEDVRESQLLGYELKDVGNLIVTMTMHMTDLQNKLDSQAEHIKMLNKKLEQTQTDRPRGHWIVIDEYSACSVCDAEIDWIDLPYCPFCGAKMDGE